MKLISSLTSQETSAIHSIQELKGKPLSPIQAADKIVNRRTEEGERQYGSFTEGMIKTAKIASELCNKELTADDMYKVLMALKLSRIANFPGFDSITDLIGYAEGYWNYIQETKK